MLGQSNNGACRTPKNFQNSSKSGPLKATIPLSSLIKHGDNSSPSKSPISFKVTMSPEYHFTGQRSPGSSIFKAKPKYSNENKPYSFMRRTVSLDTIYLKGQWPRDNYLWCDTLNLDKATQTEECFDWTDLKTSPNEANEILIIKPKSNNLKDTISTQTIAKPVLIPPKQISKISIRSSVEGLNQEIERLILKTSNEKEVFNRSRQMTPEGHRAPLAELFQRSRSVNTQTPSDFEYFGHLSGFSSRESLSFGHSLDSPSKSGGSQGSSPDQESTKLGSSPHINRFLAREPPDGCERVHSKVLNENTSLKVEGSPSQPSSFKLRPSLGSAFQILNPKISNKDTQVVAP